MTSFLRGIRQIISGLIYAQTIDENFKYYLKQIKSVFQTTI